MDNRKLAGIILSAILLAGCGTGGPVTSTVVVNTPQTTTIQQTNPDSPLIILTADSTSISRGEGVVIGWKTTNADYCVSGGSAYYGWYKPYDVMRVYPTTTSDYTITCVSKTGIATAKITIFVKP